MYDIFLSLSPTIFASADLLITGYESTGRIRRGTLHRNYYEWSP